MSAYAKRTRLEAEVFRMTEKKMGIFNEARSRRGLRQLVSKKRNCLRCDRVFLSQNYGHRMCVPCGSKSDDGTRVHSIVLG